MPLAPTIVWLPLAFIAGGLVWYYGPAEELRNSERRIEEAKAETKAKSPKRNDELAFVEAGKVAARLETMQLL